MSTESIFTKIIKGKIPCYKIAETDSFLSFLDISPNTIGHALCIPKKQVDKLFDLDKETYAQLMDFSYDVAKAIEKVVDCNRVGLSVVGLEVPHAHVHLIPIDSIKDISFMHKISAPTQEEFEQTANEIHREFVKTQSV